MGAEVVQLKEKVKRMQGTVEQHKQLLDKVTDQLAQDQAQRRAQTSEAKAKIAHAQAKQASSEEAINQINTHVAEIEQGIKNRKSTIVEVKGKIVSTGREMARLKKKVAVLKAFL